MEIQDPRGIFSLPRGYSFGLTFESAFAGEEGYIFNKITGTIIVVRCLRAIPRHDPTRVRIHPAQVVESGAPCRPNG